MNWPVGKTGYDEVNTIKLGLKFVGGTDEVSNKY